MGEFYRDEDDLAYDQRKELQERGYRSLEHKRSVESFNRAQQEYERKVDLTFDIMRRRNF